MPSRRHDSLVFTVVVSSIAALAAVPFAILMLLAGEGPSVVIASLFALLPVGPLVACYLWLDRYEPEPRSLLVTALAWGAFVATMLAILVQGLGGWFADLTDEQSLAIVAPITEEATKGLFLVLLVIWKRQEFDGVLDGIVYAGFVGIGFAFTENILYLSAAYNGTDGSAPGGLAGLGVLFVVRCLASPFAHPLFTAFIGIGLGLALSSRSTLVRVLSPVVGYLLAVGLHAAWNGSTLVADGVGFLVGYALVMVPTFVSMVIIAIWVRSKERTILTRALDDAALRGLIARDDVRHVVDLRARRQARAFAHRHGGRVAADTMRDYQQAAVELGYLHHRVLRGTAPKNYEERGQMFVERMHAIRPRIAFPVPMVAGGRHR
ncbi:RsiW-degrading membrane proteinase PrsW (M82 family) [Nocardioides daedukensis]|uniref:RsiW-degrading membrane proteinase PrsW (M82 family) n=1 Tax=Nocardioides daedukensis TaxID=634462 RepID=A0A7Y9S0P1_9ACTN|nr:PrsW family intramembrane metalloprotease [Nocardioides daedukensis]NYG58322.1 RsiW-degrading membrane proteinase PrsW (M82 family) [Nocardioides daedukensis]